MNRNRLLLIFGAFFATVVVVFLGLRSTVEPQGELVSIGGNTVHVTIVDTPEARTKGLSGQGGLAEDEGMLFVFERDGKHSFWMKDMQFSIDILWISSAMRVVDIETRVSPQSYPKSFTPDSPARYVLEVPAGYTEKHGVKEGDMLVF